MNKPALSAVPLALVLLLAACGGSGEEAEAPAAAASEEPSGAPAPAAPLDPAASPTPGATASPAPGATPAAAASPAAAPTASPAATPAPARSAAAAAAPARVAAAAPPASFATCSVCHAVQEGRNMVGPHLAGVVGRRAGSVAGANYSPAMRESGLTWTEANLDRYLADPNAVVPGGMMPPPGLTAAQRREVIDYLKTL